jgi:hypothetical protein
MSRRSAFDRDFRDLHGDDIETVEVAPGRYRAIGPSTRIGTPPVANAGLRLVVGVVGLFWTIVLSVVLAGMLILAGVAVWALLSTSSQSIPS